MIENRQGTMLAFATRMDEARWCLSTTEMAAQLAGALFKRADSLHIDPDVLVMEAEGYWQHMSQQRSNEDKDRDSFIHLRPTVDEERWQALDDLLTNKTPQEGEVTFPLADFLADVMYYSELVTGDEHELIEEGRSLAGLSK
ncbi:hypothetical protein [Marinactinospora rubrisoli]|uniref:Uncharacterized protein n=1 Tax=Marinactinospora rubrisoli TaxID=2715399 RepID=A0ABW2KN21_9ACTN